MNAYVQLTITSPLSKRFRLANIILQVQISRPMWLHEHNFACLLTSNLEAHTGVTVSFLPAGLKGVLLLLREAVKQLPQLALNDADMMDDLQSVNNTFHWVVSVIRSMCVRFMHGKGMQGMLAWVMG